MKKINTVLCVILAFLMILSGCNKNNDAEKAIESELILFNGSTYCVNTEIVSEEKNFYYLPVISNLDITKLEVNGYATSVTPIGDYDTNKDLSIKVQLSKTQDKLNIKLNEEKRISFYRFDYEIMNKENIKYNKLIEFKYLDLLIFAEEQSKEIHLDETYFCIKIVSEINCNNVINWDIFIDDYIQKNK